MKAHPTLTCKDPRRRQAIRDKGRNGIDYLEIVDDHDQRKLCVHLFGKAPEKIDKTNVLIKGGRRIRDIEVLELQLENAEDSETDASLLVTVDRPGDFSTYQLCLVAIDKQGHPTNQPFPGFDPRYACVEFSFKVGCPSDLDCKTEIVCPPEKRAEPEINYLAKDYASFRQLILDRLALIMPDWQERHVPDIGIALVEVLAYVGDYLSYYQDAVATEAYLNTARRRISVRRHARLVDYQMHEGCNARAWVTIDTKQDVTNSNIKLRDVYFTTGAVTDRGEVFEPLVANPDAPLQLYAAHSILYFYTWGDEECCLPRGATTATLKDLWDDQIETPSTPKKPPYEQSTQQQSTEQCQPPNPDHLKRKRKLHLEKGDILIFEEIIGPKTGNDDDADPSRRWAVRLTQAEQGVDPLNDQPILEIEWAAEDALPFLFCLSARRPAPDCDLLTDINVAHGNVFLVDHGETIDPPESSGPVGIKTVVGQCACEGSVVEITNLPDRFESVLQQVPLTFSQPLPTRTPHPPASSLLTQDKRKALPNIDLKSIPPAPDATASLFTLQDLHDPTLLAKRVRQPADSTAQSLRARLSVSTRDALDKWDGAVGPPPALLEDLRQDLYALLEAWTVRRDLLESGSRDRDFVVELDNESRAHLRFGDGATGQQPAAGMGFIARYRVGNGPAGNVGVDTITNIGFRNMTINGVTLHPRNPLAAQGGTDPEPMAEVKLFAPGAFRKELQRAITANDYARLAERNHKVQHAGALLRWTGSWYDAQVAVDPLGSETADDNLLREIKGCLYQYRRIGHDLAVNAAQYVPLDIEMIVCVLPHFLRGHVEAALLGVFGNRVLLDGRLGFFHPDNLTFGDGVYLSKLVAGAQAVPGVESVKVTKLQRLFEGDNRELEFGILKLGPMEIAQLDNDPSFPEHGKLKLDMRGGR